MIDTLNIQNSPSLDGASYDPSTRTLYVTLKTDWILTYRDVPPESWAAMKADKYPSRFWAISIVNKFKMRMGARGN